MALASPVYPLRASANGRFLVDQTGAPCLITGDSPHSLMVNLSEADAADFFTARSLRGFNTLWVELLCQDYTGGRPDGSMLDGTLPFTNTIPGTGSYDLSTPNEAYFAHVDRILSLAAQEGIQIMLDPIETAGWLPTMLDNGSSQCYAYGQYLGNRYRDFPNIIWMNGNDFNAWNVPANDAVVTAVAYGIKDQDPNHLQTVELNVSISSSLDDSNWWPIIDINTSYTTFWPTYARVSEDYMRTNFLPDVMGEGIYEYEDDWLGNSTLRRQEYWALLSGAAGQLYGNHYVWRFEKGWQSHLDTPAVIQLDYLRGIFGSRAWFNLVPDTNNLVVIDGFGTFTEGGTVNDSDYATTASTPDGTLVMVYVPTLRTITIDMTSLSDAAIARWFDPATGLYLPVSGSPFVNFGYLDFTPPGPNGDGDGDWVLVLETQSPENDPPLVALTSPADGATISGTINIFASASNTLGIVGLQFRVDGINLTPEVLAVPYTIQWNSANVTNGLHTLGAVARDLAGNLATNTISVWVQNASSVPTRLSLAAAYNFSEGSGDTVADASGNGNTGVVYGATWTSGRYGSGLAFDDQNSLTVANSDSLALTNGMTLIAWVNPSRQPSDWATVLLKEADAGFNYMLQTDPQGSPNVFVLTEQGLSGVASASVLPLGTWSHLAGTYDGSTLRLYVNGNEVASEPVQGNVVTSSGNLDIGTNPALGEWFHGTLDEISIYNRALTKAEIQLLMSGSLGGPALIQLYAPPQTQAEIAGVGFKLEFTADNSGFFVIETTTDLSTWQTLQTLQYTNGIVEIVDPGSGVSPTRFYRARQP